MLLRISAPTLPLRIFVMLIPVGIILLAALGSAAESVVKDGIPHVISGDNPRDGIHHLYLEPAWRAGHADDDVLFGLITQVVEDTNSDLYVLDAQLSQVHVYDQDGVHLRTLFGEGDGPGEVRGPRDLVLMADGRVGVVQEVPGKLIFVDRLNNPAGELQIGGPGVSHGGFCQSFSAFTGGDLLLVAGFVQTPGDEPGHMLQTNFLSSFDAEGRQIAEICVDRNDIDFSKFTFDETRHLAAYWWNAAIGPDGKIYVAPYLDQHEIHVFRGDGTLERVIERDYSSWRRTQAEKKHFEEVVRAIYGEAPIEIKVVPSDNEPMIAMMQRGLRVHGDGTIWVLTTHGIRDQAPGVMVTFDVYSPSGEYVRQVAVHFDADARHDGVFLLQDDRAVVVKGFVDAAMAQFTGGRMSVDFSDAEATMEMIYCCVR